MLQDFLVKNNDLCDGVLKERQPAMPVICSHAPNTGNYWSTAAQKKTYRGESGSTVGGNAVSDRSVCIRASGLSVWVLSEDFHGDTTVIEDDDEEALLLRTAQVGDYSIWQRLGHGSHVANHSGSKNSLSPANRMSSCALP